MELPRGRFGLLAADREDRQAPAVRAAHADADQLAAAHETQRREKQVVGLKHWTLPWTAGGEVG